MCHLYDLILTFCDNQYGIGLNSSVILGSIDYGGIDYDSDQVPVYDKSVLLLLPFLMNRLYNLGVGNLILSLAGLIPGHVACIAAIDVIGRRTLQIAGFAVLTVLLCIIGSLFYSLSPQTLLVLFCLCNFVANVGPNTTTFVIPGELFPTRYKATAYGISAASGKIGSIISQALWGALKDKGGANKSVNHVFQIYALFMYSFLSTCV